MLKTKELPILPKIIKRFELIKNFISLEEHEEINTQISKLRELGFDRDEIKSILALLDNKYYSEALFAINNFINQHNQLASYSDPELEGLKFEAKAHENTINSLSNEKADIEKLIHDFSVRHSNELGELILGILTYRRERAKGTSHEFETERDYSEYKQEYETNLNRQPIELTDEEFKELKLKYRKASNLCHPDVVNDDQKELADKMFADLSAAFERNDLQRVNEILTNLEKGNFFLAKSSCLNEKQLLKSQIERLRIRVEELQSEIHALKESDAYKTISSIKDWDEYFTSTKHKLEKQLKDFKDE